MLVFDIKENNNNKDKLFIQIMTSYIKQKIAIRIF